MSHPNKSLHVIQSNSIDHLLQFSTYPAKPVVSCVLDVTVVFFDSSPTSIFILFVFLFFSSIIKKKKIACVSAGNVF